MNGSTFLILCGVIVFAVGLGLPADVTQQERVCMTDTEYCTDDEAMIIERTVENEKRIPTIAGGAVLTIVGLGLTMDQGGQEDGGEDTNTPGGQYSIFGDDDIED